MKKWHIIVLASLALVAALIVGGSAFYKYYIVPEYLQPVMEKVRDYVNDDEVLDELYNQVDRLKEEGVIDESTYAKFVDSYKKHNRNNEAYARDVLDSKDENESDSSSKNTSISAKHASTKVGVEAIQTNDGGSGGKSATRYSEERTSDRIKAEDIVEAEKVLYDKESEKETPDQETVQESAYDILRANMTSNEFSTFLSIMKKLDSDVLATFVDKDSMVLKNKEGLKEYMHSCLSNEEYKTIVNMGYKYVYLFIEK